MNSDFRFYLYIAPAEPGAKQTASDEDVFRYLGADLYFYADQDEYLLCSDGCTRRMYLIPFPLLMKIEEEGCVCLGRDCELFENSGDGTLITPYQNPSAETEPVSHVLEQELLVPEVSPPKPTVYIISVTNFSPRALKYLAKEHGLMLARQNLNIDSPSVKVMTVYSNSRESMLEFLEDNRIDLSMRKSFEFYIREGDERAKRCRKDFIHLTDK
jgi:hypothetical protein